MFNKVSQILLLGVLVQACVTRQQVESEIYMNDGLPLELCERVPELRQYGIYRVVKCVDSRPECSHGEEFYDELLPYCSLRIKEFLSADRVQVEKWLNEISKPK